MKLNRRNFLSTSALAITQLGLVTIPVENTWATEQDGLRKSICGWVPGSLEPTITDVVFEADEPARHIGFVRRAIQLSKDAVAHCNHPFGAILVHEGRVILKAENRVFTDGDATQHAELRLISDANKAQHISPEMLKKSVLYTSAEPCAMCCGAIFWSGVRQVVYAAPHDSFGSEGTFPVPCREVFKFARKTQGTNSRRSDESVTVIGPLLKEESVPTVSGYFKDKVVEEFGRCTIDHQV
ncbi:MAG: tRNA(Arg) A34 adenosine deaminase TadA [Candidatus Azotimanducaceae bacterium]|jgi:tRNA(Arg) A34 adenosine deaminase TadA